jgi:hypothetical protein
LIIADAAGGDWPERARVAAVALVADSREGKAVSLGIRLLGDIRRVWDGSDGMHTDVLLEALNNLDEAPWGDLRGKPLDPRGLSKFLREYDVRPGDVRTGSDVRKGYKRAELHDAWQRYLPAEKSATSATCAGCGEQMKVIEPGQQYHPMCEPEDVPAAIPPGAAPTKGRSA